MPLTSIRDLIRGVHIASAACSSYTEVSSWCKSQQDAPSRAKKTTIISELVFRTFDLIDFVEKMKGRSIEERKYIKLAQLVPNFLSSLSEIQDSDNTEENISSLAKCAMRTLRIFVEIHADAADELSEKVQNSSDEDVLELLGGRDEICEKISFQDKALFAVRQYHLANGTDMPNLYTVHSHPDYDHSVLDYNKLLTEYQKVTQFEQLSDSLIAKCVRGEIDSESFDRSFTAGATRLVESAIEADKLIEGVEYVKDEVYSAIGHSLYLVSDKVDDLGNFFQTRESIRQRHQQRLRQAQHVLGTNLARLVDLSVIPDQLHDDPVLSRYTCPVTYSPIRHPVIDPTSRQIFEKSALTEWVAARGNSPLTRRPLTLREIQDDRETLEIIENRLNYYQNRIDAALRVDH